MMRSMLTAVLMAAGLAWPMAGRAADPVRPETWLVPMPPLTAPGDPRSGATDYFDMFKPGAPWDYVAKRIKVFEIYRDRELLMSDDQLRLLLHGLADRHIALGMETNALMATSTCAPGVGKAGPITAEVERLKRLGGDLRFIAMNEPLISGHAMTGPRDCHASIAAVAADVANFLKPLMAVFPELQVGDIEPIGDIPAAAHAADMQNWPQQVGQWMAAYKAATGRPLAFLHSDVVWDRDWQGDLRQMAQISHAAGVPFGVLYHGDLTEMSDAALAANTARYVTEVERTLGIHLDHAVFQSWYNWPRRALPDTDLTTMTGMVRDYDRKRTTLTVSGTRVRLTDEMGAPVVNARIGVDINDPVPGTTLAAQRVTGEVPPGAVGALLALRVHTDCLCAPAAAQIDLAGFQYGETPPAYDGAKYVWDFHQWGTEMPPTAHPVTLAGTPGVGVAVTAGQKFALNGPRFPVHAGAPFEARFTWQVSPPADGTGYLAIVFLGANGIETKRTMVRLTPTWRRAATLTTDAAGFAGFLEAAGNGKVVSLAYAGDGDHGPARVDVP
jgi:hypothetical protein